MPIEERFGQDCIKRPKKTRNHCKNVPCCIACLERECSLGNNNEDSKKTGDNAENPLFMKFLKSEEAAENPTIEGGRIDNDAHIRYGCVFERIGEKKLVYGYPDNTEEAKGEEIPERYLYISEKKE